MNEVKIMEDMIEMQIRTDNDNTIIFSKIFANKGVCTNFTKELLSSYDFRKYSNVLADLSEKLYIDNIEVSKENIDEFIMDDNTIIFVSDQKEYKIYRTPSYATLGFELPNGTMVF